MLSADYRALVVGATGSIGQAFLDYFKSDTCCAQAIGLSRSSEPRLDLREPDSIRAAARSLAQQGLFDIIVDATGALTIDGQGPEKSLQSLDPAQLMASLQINTIGPALVLQQFTPLLRPGDAFYAKLSARVGSISDNRLGGWYSYRASKAAMNMVLHTAAIESQRRQPNWRFVALQPGTVRSRLSAPFASGVAALLDPAESVAGMMKALRSLAPQAGASFIDHRGEPIDW